MTPQEVVAENLLRLQVDFLRSRAGLSSSEFVVRAQPGTEAVTGSLREPGIERRWTMVALGLLLLAGAGLTVLVGFFANNGSDHTIPGGFELFGYDISGSTGRLFLYGAIVGVVGMLGLNLLLTGLGRGVKHKVANRRERKTYRRGNETLQEERDRLARELDDERAARAAEPDLEREVPARPVPSSTRCRRSSLPARPGAEHRGRRQVRPASVR